MSRDYTGLMYPKPGKKKRSKKHLKPILNTCKGECFLCALEGNRRQQYTEEHHIVFGGGGRSRSEEEGLKVYLCRRHHRDGPEAVHNCKETREKLCRIAQEEYEKTHTREEWMKIASRNYLDLKDGEKDV